jgi:hypothetical protein
MRDWTYTSTRSDLGTREWWVVRFTAQPPHWSREEEHSVHSVEAGRSPAPVWTLQRGGSPLILPGNIKWRLGHPAPSLVAILSYPGSTCGGSVLDRATAASEHSADHYSLSSCHHSSLYGMWFSVVKKAACYSYKKYKVVWPVNLLFLISNIRRILNVVCFLLGCSSASVVQMSTFRNTFPAPSS